jgi:inorganic pyrophosphatase
MLTHREHEAVPRALLLDLGGVWIQDGDLTERARWAAAHGMDADQLYHAYLEAIGPGWEGGRSDAEIHELLLAACGADRGELDALLRALHAHETLDPSITNMVATLRASGVLIGIISNAGPNARAALCEKFGLDERSDVMLISAEVGVSKPHPHIYEEATRLLGVARTDCVFVDDKPANVEAARALGMAGIDFVSVEQACADITSAIGVDVGRLVPAAWLGRTVHVVVDRPLGAEHPSGTFSYETSYGFVPGFRSPDGEALDAYVLGPPEPVATFGGTVVGVVLRRDDVEDKLVVSDRDGWTAATIEAAIRFQERFFDSTVVTEG